MQKFQSSEFFLDLVNFCCESSDFCREACGSIAIAAAASCLS